MDSTSSYLPRKKTHKPCDEPKCGALFLTTRRDAKFCSPACRQANSRRARFIARVKGTVASTNAPQLGAALVGAVDRAKELEKSSIRFFPAPAPTIAVTDKPNVSQDSALVPMPAIAAAPLVELKSVTSRRVKPKPAGGTKKKTPPARPSAKMKPKQRPAVKKSVTAGKGAKRPAKKSPGGKNRVSRTKR